MKRLPLKRAYASFDFGNSAYLIVVQNFVLPLYFSTILIDHWFTLASWGWVNAISTAIGIIGWVIFWYLGDKTNKLLIFAISMIVSCLTTLAIAYYILYDPSMIYWMYMMSNASFIISLSIYNSLLTDYVPGDQRHAFSGFAWGIGYLWGIIWLIVTLVVQNYFWQFDPLIFIVVAVFYGVFASTSILSIRKYTPLNHPLLHEEPIQKQDKALLLFSYRLISECVTVVFLFFSIYGTQELWLSSNLLGGLILLSQLIGLPATIYGTKYIIPRLGEKKAMNIYIVMWLIAIGGLLIGGYRALWITIVVGGLSMWSLQSLMRSEYASLVNPRQSGYEFGFFVLATQIASSIGPIAYGYMSDALGSQKIPLSIFALLMAIGWIILYHIPKKSFT